MWANWAFSVACLAVASHYATVLIAHSVGTRNRAGEPRVSGYELSHLGMALGMAAMFSPLGDPVPQLVWLIVFGIAAAWFAACLLQASVHADDAAHHHLIANLAMLLMVAGGHSRHGAGGAAGGPGGSGHEGHTAAAGGAGWIEGPIGTVLIVVLAGYFVVHTVRSFRVLLRTPTQAAAVGTGLVTVVVARSATVQAACHAVMGIAMVVMLGLML